MTSASRDLSGISMRTVEENPWNALRRFTDARIALGRSGASLPTAPLLAFTVAHAQARDAVHTPLDLEGLRAELDRRTLDSIEVRSAAQGREQYLRRPDLGRMMDPESVDQLTQYPA